VDVVPVVEEVCVQQPLQIGSQVLAHGAVFLLETFQQFHYLGRKGLGCHILFSECCNLLSFLATKKVKEIGLKPLNQERQERAGDLPKRRIFLHN
jgi:hypothetical protein